MRSWKLAELPLPPNGKVDRNRLAVRPLTEMSRTTAYVAARDATEKVIMKIWPQVLNRQDIGIRDNFFELGGHSLQATQIILRLREVYPADGLSLRGMFENPTVEGLANMLKQLQFTEVISETLMEMESPPPETSGNSF